MQQGWGLLALFIGCLRFLYLRADFPNFSPWSVDQAKYTDEGWWASAAIRHRLLGHWNLPGDYNPAVVLPVWPCSLDILFRFTGVSMVAARALSVATSIATLTLVALLVRRYTRPGSGWAPVLAVLLLSTSPFAFVYSRLAILDTFVIFQFCLLMLIASYADENRVAALASVAVLIPVIVLTKTTAVVLLPAVAWLLWRAMTGTPTKIRMLAVGLVGLIAALLVRAYVAFVFLRGHEIDYREFYDVNSLTPIDWTQTIGILEEIFVRCMWIGRIVFPLAIALVALAILWLRTIWRNPLFVASCLAIAGQVTFLFATQGSFAPRYFLPMLVPIVVLIALTMEELKTRVTTKSYDFTLVLVGIALVLNILMIRSFLAHRTFQFYDAARSVERTVRADANSNHLILGVSAADLSLITGLPSINDVYGTQSLPERIATYKPDWYLAWNGVGSVEQDALAGYRIEKVAAYPAFDDDERDILVLYRLRADNQ